MAGGRAGGQCCTQAGTVGPGREWGWGELDETHQQSIQAAGPSGCCQQTAVMVLGLATEWGAQGKAD